ncbi:MAG: dihydroxyacetone kinase subunit DhaL [Actinomycetota bacterium]|nr:dihydroxyacetone kinase subunit DhaL [Actinomycetota bacterium]
MQNILNIDDFIAIIKIASKEIDKNKEYLSNLDSVIGDGDHGTTISTAFTKINKELASKNFTSIPDLLKFIGNLFITSIGGTTGPIFGYIFIGMASELSDLKYEEVSLSEFYHMLSGALQKVVSIGKANPGDKTLVDTLNAAVNSLRNSVEKNIKMSEGIRIMAAEAQKGAESTKDMIAVKGRARYLGERSIGHQDAGATSVSIILNAFNIYLQSK